MAKTQKGPVNLTEGEFIDELATRLEKQGIDRKTVAKVIKGFKDEATECIANGYKINLSGFLTLTPASKPGRKKGTAVRNPATGETTTLKADQPDKFKVKARVSPKVVGLFPGLGTKDGKALMEQLAPAKKAAKS